MKKSNDRVRLKECCAGGMASPAKPGSSVIKDCKILGLKSRNGRSYLPEAVVRAAPLYEGKPVFIDHAAKGQETRPFLERFGTFRNVKGRPDGIYGDLHFNPKHLYAATFLGWLESDPSGVGFSHSATGSVREQNGELVVTEITEVESVDLVAVPATTQGIYESHMNDDMDEPMLDMPPEEEEAPIEEAPVLDDEPAGGGHEEHLAAAVTSIFKDPALSGEEKKKKILALLKILDDEGTDSPSPAPTEEAPFEESDDEEGEEEEEEEYEEALTLKKKVKELQAKLSAYELKEAAKRAEKECRELCAKQHLPEGLITPKFISMLAEAKTKEERIERINDRKSVMNFNLKTPVSKPPVKGADESKLTVDDLLATFNEVK
jgi:hypothetical protein